MSTPRASSEPPPAPTVCGITLPGFPRAFTLKELRAYQEIGDKHDYEAAQSDYAVEEGRAKLERRNARLAAVRANIEALEKRRHIEFERDDLQPDRLTMITDWIVAAKEEEARLELEALPDAVKEFQERDERTARLIEVQERVYLETIHALAGLHDVKVPKLEEFREQATWDDHEAAAAIVETGLSALPLNRATRRAAARRAAAR